jgi:phosphoenolpyruvate synthase/pyruvate phosphate dikinase
VTTTGKPAILVRRDTVKTDIEGMALAAGILTASGGRTSHAAVVARQLGKVCLGRLSRPGDRLGAAPSPHSGRR